VNTLQLLTHVPLLSIVMPSNALSFFGFLISVSNFSIVDLSGFQMDLFSFNEKEQKPHSVNFGRMGYESTNSILNMGNVFLTLVFATTMIVAVKIFESVFVCCKCLRNSIRYIGFE